MSETLENKAIAIRETPRTHLNTHEGRELTAKQERFAQLYASGFTGVEAYRAAYDPAGSAATVRVHASRLAHHPRVAARVQALRDEAAADSPVRSVAGMIAELEEMVRVDPRELATVRTGSCRHCYGTGGAYQWRDGAELARAFDAWMRDPASGPAPDGSGGTGFDQGREPNPDCTSCGGDGVQRAVYANLDDVSPAAARLVRRIETHADGSIKALQLADQTQLRTELHKLRGLHVDRSVSLVATVNVPPMHQWTNDQFLDYLDTLPSCNNTKD